MHPVVPWLIGLALLLPVPLLENVSRFLKPYTGFELFNSNTQFVINVMAINILLAVGLNIVKGFAGQVTIGHIALMAIGSYASAVFAVKVGLPFWFALPLAVLITASAGALVGIPSLRLEGAYLALATLGLAESVRIIINGTDYLGGGIGFSDIPPPSILGKTLDQHANYYFIVMPVALAGIYFSFSILSSDIGRAFKSIREDPLAAAASGVNVAKYKIIAFILSAIYAGFAGSLKAHLAPGFIHPDSYKLEEMVTLLLMVVLGGLGHIWGGVVGAIVVTMIVHYTHDLYTIRLLVFGLIIVLTVMFMPQGIGGIVDNYIVRRRFKAIRQETAARLRAMGKPDAA
ncbi:MAG: branched-chain amino acid ABC transporter permease [Hyphomicrobiaceae bacterium]|nr:MAG: branched-chain amino acid ABC transporter permease [Hyphomicrobiaceae bacterium]